MRVAVSTTFVVCPVGEWTSVVLLRAERTALWIQSLEGAVILCPTSAGPVVAGLLGDSPAGYLHSPFSGPLSDTFRLNAQEDTDLVTQQWWAWPLPAAPVPPFGSEWGGTVMFASPYTYGTGGGWIGTWVIVTYSASTGPNPIALASSLHGAQVPVSTQTLSDGMGDQLQIDVYLVPGQNDSDTWTFTFDPLNGTCAIEFANWSIGTTGVATLATGANNPIAVTSPGTNATLLAVFVAIGFGAAATDDTVTGYTATVVKTVYRPTSPDGTQWYTTAYVGVVPTAVSVPISTVTDVALPSWAAQVVLGEQPSVVAGSVTLTVSEAFATPAIDDPDWVDPTQTITVSLPRLSRAGVMALHRLMGRSTEDGEQ